MVSVEDFIKQPVDVKTIMDFIRSSDPQTKINGESVIPTKQIYIPVDAQQVIKTGTVKPERAAEIVPRIDFNLKNRLTKSELMVIEMLKENNWNRPMYFAVTVGDDYYLGLNDHFELTGMAYQIVPVGAKGAGPGVNTDEMYENVMHKFRFGGINNPKVYIDENIGRMCRTHRMFIGQLAGALLAKGDSVKAKTVLDYCNKMIPGTTVRHDYTSVQLADYYYKLGEIKKGDAIMNAVAKDCVEYLNWGFSLTPSQQNSITGEMGNNYAVLNQVLRICDENKRKNIMDKYLPSYMQYSRHFQM